MNVPVKPRKKTTDNLSKLLLRKLQLKPTAPIQDEDDEDRREPSPVIQKKDSFLPEIITSVDKENKTNGAEGENVTTNNQNNMDGANERTDTNATETTFITETLVNTAMVQKEDDVRATEKMDEETRESSSSSSSSSSPVGIKKENYYGREAKRRFWNMFRKGEDNQTKVRPTSARTLYLQETKRQGLLPEPMGIIRKTEAPHIDLHGYGMGDEYGLAFGKSFYHIPDVESLNLSRNRLCDNAVESIIEGVAKNPKVKRINFSHNALGIKSTIAIEKHLSSVLEYLNVQQCSLNEEALLTLLNGFQKSSSLRSLNISRNKLSNSCMAAVASLIATSDKLERLYMSWTDLNGAGAERIIDTLQNSNSVRAVDLSWNNLGSHLPSSSNGQIVTKLATLLETNTVLQHLDISNNRFSQEDISALAVSLAKNHNLIGLHVFGNEGYLDAKGFLHPSTNSARFGSHSNYCSIHAHEESWLKESTANADPSCWYCSRWTEHKFTWYPTSSINIGTEDSVYLHLSIDQWSGDPMQKKEDGTYFLYRVVPPKRIKYCFSVVNKLTETQLSNRTWHINHDKKTCALYPSANKEDNFGSLSSVNFVDCKCDENDCPCSVTSPRSTTAYKSTQWDVKKSPFSSRPQESHSKGFYDSPQFLQKAFIADWKQCKIDRIVKDATQRQELQNAVSRYYRELVQAYLRACANSTISNSKTSIYEFSYVSWTGFLDFAESAHILDESSGHCKMSDLENVFVAANLEITTEAKEVDNPDRSLTRFEFLEACVRIALSKASRGSQPAVAFEDFVVHHLLPLKAEDPNEFRSTLLYTEEVSDVFLEYLPTVQKLFDENSKTSYKPGEKGGMSIAEFNSIMTTYGIAEGDLKARELQHLFLLSKTMVIDEMTTNSHKKLFFSEFLELLLRTAILKFPIQTKTPINAARSLEALFTKCFAVETNGMENIENLIHDGTISPNRRRLSSMSKKVPHTRAE